jgi:hypothetical protein
MPEEDSNPDTRIMIPLLLGSVAGFEGSGGPKTGQECTRGCPQAVGAAGNV